jgi:deoxyadenosine/deoxycytidine kinase
MEIGIVGPCASGKTTLKNELKDYGYQVKHIAQEHSYVPDMWKRLSKPDILIYLDVSFELTKKRKTINWTEHEYLIQVKRLEHARKHADIYIQTDHITENEVLNTVLDNIKSLEINKK